MKRTLEQLKSLYPIGTMVAYERSGNQKYDLGSVVNYCRVPDGCTAEDDSWALKVQNLEFPEYQQIVVPGQNNFKAYYNWKAVNRDHKNRYFL